MALPVIKADDDVMTDSRDVGEVQGSRRGKDVGVVFWAGLLEAVEGRVAVVFGEALVLVAFARKLDAGVFGQRDAQRLPMQPLAIQVTHSCKSDGKKTLFKFPTSIWRPKDQSERVRGVTQLSLCAVRHLNQSVLLLVEQNLHPHHIPINTLTHSRRKQQAEHLLHFESVTQTQWTSIQSDINWSDCRLPSHRPLVLWSITLKSIVKMKWFVSKDTVVWVVVGVGVGGSSSETLPSEHGNTKEFMNWI